MESTIDIANEFGSLYHPVSALVIFQEGKTNGGTYVEYYDMDKDGKPVNAHPLTVREADALAKSLLTKDHAPKAFLKPTGIMPTNVLHIDPTENGGVIWFTPSGKRQLYFSDRLGIPNGIAEVPPLVWKATKTGLSLFSLYANRRPGIRTVLFHAPFFNVYRDGRVCMGSVDVAIKSSISLEGFMAAWEGYFFNSYFSHLVEHHDPIKGNCVHLWTLLLKDQQPFPKDVLIKTTKTLKNLLS